MRKKRKVLSLWLTLILVFVALLGVVGVTFLTLFLMGRFEQPKVEPEDLSVMLTDDSMGYQQGNGSFFVSDSFKLVINTTTENVTEKTVRLTLSNSISQPNGFVTNGKITIPSEVEIGKAFDVTVAREYDSAAGGNVIVGGHSTITARSTNISLTPTYFFVDVDVPVSDIKVNIKPQEGQTQQTGEIQTVVVSSEFELNVDFTPTKSQYFYADTENKKEILNDIFLSTTNSFISFDWTSKKFYANRQSGGAYDSVTVYTFVNEYYRKQAYDEMRSQYGDITDMQEKNRFFLSYFTRNPNARKTATVNIQVEEASVEKVKTSNKTISVKMDEKTSFTTAFGDVSLGLKIEDFTGSVLSGMNDMVGIKHPALDGFRIVGDKVIKVVTENGRTTFEEEDYSSAKDYSEVVTGSRTECYYILPITSRDSDPSKYVWDFVMERENVEGFDDLNLSLKVNFFEHKGATLENFFSFNENADEGENRGCKEASISLSITQASVPDIEWRDGSSITLEINYDEFGNPTTPYKNLSNDLLINGGDTQKTVRYFLFATNAETENQILSVFDNIGSSKNYTQKYKGDPLTIVGASGVTRGYNLFEINRSTIYAQKVLRGEVYVVAAVVRFKADGTTPYQDQLGRYQIISISRARALNVAASLSLNNMAASFSFDTAFGSYKETGEYYIPAINRDESQRQKDVIKFKFVLNNANADLDVDKVLQAIRDDQIRFECLDSNENKTENFVVLNKNSVRLASRTDTQLVFEGTMQIDESKISHDATRKDLGLYIKPQLVYDNGKDVLSKEMFYDAEESELDHFFVYYPQPVSIVGNEQFPIPQNVENKTIKIDIKTSGDSYAKWGVYDAETDSMTDAIDLDGAGTTISTVVDKLNAYFSFSLLDQFDRVIDTNSGLYSVNFVEIPEGTNGNALGFSLKNDSLVNFQSITNPLTGQPMPTSTHMVVYVLDRILTSENRRDCFVPVYDAMGVATTNNLATATFNFLISSEGITKVEKDNEVLLGNSNFVENLGEDGKINRASVAAFKYVTTGSKIIPSELLRVFSDNSDTPIPNLKVKLSNTFLDAMQPAMQEQLRSMLSFKDTDGRTIQDWKGAAIREIEILRPFNTNTPISFTVSDQDEKIFTLELVLTLGQTFRVNQNFSNYFDQDISDLIYNGEVNHTGVFGGFEYDLDKALPISKTFVNASDTTEPLTWKKIFENVSNADLKNCLSTQTAGLCSLSKDADGTIKLKLEEVVRPTPIRLTIYCGANNNYCLHVLVGLYINPNLLVVENEEDSYIDLTTIAGTSEEKTSLLDIYSFYKVTDFIQNNKRLSGLTAMDASAIGKVVGTNEFAYDSGRDLLSVKPDFGFSFGEAGQAEFKLGQTFNQTLKWMTTGRDSTAISAVQFAADGTITKADENVKLDFVVGYGTDVSRIVIEKTSNSTEVIPTEVVSYNNGSGLGTYLILDSNKTYKVGQAGATFANVSGWLHINSNELMVLNINEIVSYGGNSVTVRQQLETDDHKVLNVSVQIDVIVSTIGDKFVYYNNGTLPEPNRMKFNHFVDGDGQEISFDRLVGNLTTSQIDALIADGVYQNLDAGAAYNILHIGNNPKTTDVFGFYCANSQNLVVDVDFERGGEYASIRKETSDGQTIGATISLQSLSSNSQPTYIVLRLRITNNNLRNSFTWFYIIKVDPDFEEGKVNYPYVEADANGQYSNATDGEYLDVSSDYYNSETDFYSINLNEPFTTTTAKTEMVTKTRFEAPTFTKGNTPSLTADYSVEVVDGNANDFAMLQVGGLKEEIKNDIDPFDGVLRAKLKNNSAKATIKVTKTFYANGKIMTGSKLEYFFFFNQGEVYTNTLTVSKGDSANELTANNNTFETIIVAEGLTYTFSGKVSAVVAGGTNTITPAGKYMIGADDAAQVEFVGLTENGEITLNDDGIFTFTITPKAPEQVTEDETIEIGFYTAQKRAFKLVVTITNRLYVLKNDLNTTFKAGQKYYFASNDENSVFNLSQQNEEYETAMFEIESVEGQDDSLFAIEKVSEKTKADGSVNEDYNPNNNAIIFAHLTQDKTFKFKATITWLDEAGSTLNYNFTFDVLVEASFRESESIDFDRTDISLYGEDQVVLSSDVFASKIGKLNTEETSKYSRFMVWDAESHQYVDTATFEVADVNARTIGLNKQIKLAYQFASDGNFGSNNFEFFVNYTYTVEPSVEVEANHPVPDASTKEESKFEYLSTFESSELGYKYQTAEISNFLDLKADMSILPRITRNDIRTLGREEEKVGENYSLYNGEILRPITLSKNYSVSVASIDENVCVDYSIDTIGAATSGLSRAIDSRTVNKSIEAFNGDEKTLRLKFKLSPVGEAYNDGTVTFNVSLNGVSTQYSVYVVRGSAFLIELHQPNAQTVDNVSNTEMVYAEDLKGKSLNLFTQNRILQVEFLNSAGLTEGARHYARFLKGSTYKEYPIEVVNKGNISYIDLGENLTGFEYVGTFLSRRDDTTASDAARNMKEDEGLYASTPVLTQRAEMKYKDGKSVRYIDKINFDSSEEGSKQISMVYNIQQIAYQFKTSVDMKVGYDISFKSSSTGEVFQQPVYSNGTGMQQSVSVNRDLTDFEYVATYNENGSKMKDEDIWINTPFVNETTAASLEEFALTEEDFKVANTIFISVKNSDDTIVSTGVNYNMYFTIDFKVEGNADRPVSANNSLSYVEIEVDRDARSDRSLLEFDAFGIKRMKVNEKYTQDLMRESGGKFSVDIYGLNTLPIVSSSDALTQTAYTIHNDLIQNGRMVDGHEIIYEYGLSPRNTGLTENGVVSGSSDANFISLSGVTSDTGDTDIDYYIHPHGAGTDGNFVMLRLTYLVEVTEGLTVTEEHNLLIKVVPNSSVTMKSGENGTMQATTQFVDDHTVVSNKNNPYIISFNDLDVTNEKELVLWRDKDNAASAISAAMYGVSGDNSANAFTYTYTSYDYAFTVDTKTVSNPVYTERASDTDSTMRSYNDWSVFNAAGRVTPEGENSTSYNRLTSNQNWQSSISSLTYTGLSANVAGSTDDKQLVMKVPNLALGEKYFFIDFENEYGFKGRFYFTVVSKLSPKINSVNGSVAAATLVEGSTMGIGAMFQEMSINDAKSATSTSDNGASGNKVTTTTREATYTYKFSHAKDENDKDINEILLSGNGIESLKSAILTANIDGDLRYEGGTNAYNVNTIYKECNIEKVAETNQSKITFSNAKNGDKWVENWKWKDENGEHSINEAVKFLWFETEILCKGEFTFKDFVLTLTFETKFNDEKNSDGSLKNPEAEMNSYSVTYAGKALPASVGSSPKNPDFDETAETKAANTVIMSGFDAYGFKKEYVTIDNEIAKNKISNVQNIKVKRVDFYLGDKWLGSSLNNEKNGADKTSITNLGTDTNQIFDAADILTDDNFTFVNGYTEQPADGEDKASFVNGISYDNNIFSSTRKTANVFKIPFINGIEFDEFGTLQGVTMTITLADTQDGNVTDDSNTAQISTQVVIQRATQQTSQENKSLFFTSTDIADNSGPAIVIMGKDANGAGQSSENHRLLNDTLEIKLQPHEEISLLVHNDFIEFVTEKQEAGAGKFFKNAEGGFEYSYNKAVVTRAEDGRATTTTHLEWKAANVIILSNDRDFAVSKYISISNSVTEGILTKNLDEGANIYVKVLSDTVDSTALEEANFTQELYYDNTKLTNPSLTMKIATSSSIVLHINHVDELLDGDNIRDYKEETLYYLIKRMPTSRDDSTNAATDIASGGNKIYQLAQRFKVYPKFNEINKTENLSSDTILVSNYSKMQYTQGSVAEKEAQSYYIIEPHGWLNSGLETYNTFTKLTHSMEGGITTRQFTFEINTTGEGGAGSAFIDETGLITTTKAFNIQSHTITVNMYMKVSGAYGRFEDDNKILNLDPTHKLRLKLKEGVELNNTYDEEGVYYDWLISNMYMVTIPKGYEWHRISHTATKQVDNNPTELTETFVLKTGEVASFHEMFDDIMENTEFVNGTNSEDKISQVSNLYYHLVKIGDEYVYFNNVDSYKFDKAGSYKLTILAAGRKPSNSDKNTDYIYFAPFTVNIVVYDSETQKSFLRNLTTDETAYDLTEDLHDDFAGSNLVKVTEIASDGTVSSVSKDENSGAYNITLQKGLTTRTFLATYANGTSSTVDITFFVRDTSEDKAVDVGLNFGSAFNLENLIDTKDGHTYQFYFADESGTPTTVCENNTDTRVSVLSSNTTREYKYYVVDTDNALQTSDVTLYTVTYKVMQPTGATYGMYVNAQANAGSSTQQVDATEIKNRLESILKANNRNSDVTITALQNRNPADGVLTDWWKEKDGNASKYMTVATADPSFLLDFLVSYTRKSGSSTTDVVERISIMLYTYQTYATLDVAIGEANSFNLSQLDAEILSLLGLSEDSTVRYMMLDGSATNLVMQSTAVGLVARETPYTFEYYVRVNNENGETYHFVTVNFHVKAAVGINDANLEKTFVFANENGEYVFADESEYYVALKQKTDVTGQINKFKKIDKLDAAEQVVYKFNPEGKDGKLFERVIIVRVEDLTYQTELNTLQLDSIKESILQLAGIVEAEKYDVTYYSDPTFSTELQESFVLSEDAENILYVMMRELSEESVVNAPRYLQVHVTGEEQQTLANKASLEAELSQKNEKLVENGEVNA